jgi:SAM-dependent methyltransferase
MKTQHSSEIGLSPYAEGSDKFQERYGDFSARLHVSHQTGHSTFMPKPTEEFLNNYYNGGFSGGGNETYSLEAQFSPSVIDVARGVRDHMRGVAKLGETFNYHDFGCAFGGLVYGFQQIGVRATGNEPNERWVEAGNAYCHGALTSAPLEEALEKLDYKIDLFTALHVIEHLVDPLSSLRTIKQNLSPDGIVYICVPNGHSMQYILGGRRKDPQYSFPMHLNYFTAKSMISHLREVGLEPFHLDTRWLSDELNGPDYVFEAAFGTAKDKLVSSEDWVKAMCANLLGGELFILAGHPANTVADRAIGIDERAEKAFALASATRKQHGRKGWFG